MNKIAIIQALTKDCQADLDQVLKQVDFKSKLAQLEECKTILADANLWQTDKLKAQTTHRTCSKLENSIQPWLDLKTDLSDLIDLSQSYQQSKSEADFVSELQALFNTWQKKLEELKKQLRFSGVYDDYEVILSIFAGAGGTDAQDWTQMLLRMYSRWAEQQGVKTELISQSKGEEAGLKSVSVYLRSQPFLYGRLKGEHGVHRLVRLSPFNAQNLRQTSFAKVEIIPALEQKDDIILKDAELRFDYFKSGGHGGQSVNTTDSAVRVTHLPTKLTVVIQNERSQIQNKELALVVLRSRLAKLQTEKQTQTLTKLKGVNTANEWGSQIRNYVLHPYKQIKDLRTQYTTNDVAKVLDGHLEELLRAS